jgi:Flp pilus assembly protein CpaB
MKVQTLTLSVLALGCGLVAAYLTAQLLPNGSKEMSVTILVSAKPIPRGTSLRDCESLFTTKLVSSDTLLPFAYVQNFDQLREKAKDHILQKDLREGEPLSLDYLIERTKALEFLVRPGFVAFGVRATPENSFAGLIQPENYVKVLRLKGAGNDRHPQILMKNIRVIAVDWVREKNPDGVGRIPGIISLEVTDEEAKILTAAQSEGPLSLTLIAYGTAGDLKDRAGEAEPKGPPAPVDAAPGIVGSPAQPPAGHRTVIRQGSSVSVAHWNDEQGRISRTETLGPDR